MIRDDQGEVWIFDPKVNRVRLRDDDSEDSGYHCCSEEEGLLELIINGYIIDSERRLAIILKMAVKRLYPQDVKTKTMDTAMGIVLCDIEEHLQPV